MWRKPPALPAQVAFCYLQESCFRRVICKGTKEGKPPASTARWLRVVDKSLVSCYDSFKRISATEFTVAAENSKAST